MSSNEHFARFRVLCLVALLCECFACAARADEPTTAVSGVVSTRTDGDTLFYFARSGSMQELMQKADAGDPIALVYVGIMYREGVGGVERNTRRATELFFAAAVQGHSDAQCGLGDIYTYTEPRPARAFFWLTLCAQTETRLHEAAIADAPSDWDGSHADDALVTLLETMSDHDRADGNDLVRRWRLTGEFPNP